MHIIKKDIIELIREGEWVCVTTNEFVKNNGENVMGRGNAAAIKQHFPRFPLIYGAKLDQGHRGTLVFESWKIIAFPVKVAREECLPDKSNVVSHMQKTFQPGQTVPGWACKARLNVIKASIMGLIVAMQTVKSLKGQTIYLPVPGCGAGELLWKDVERLFDEVDHPLMSQIQIISKP